MKLRVLAALFLAVPLFAQTAATPDPFKGLSFLEGTWEARTAAGGAAASAGTYSFAPELRNHILARHTVTAAGCKGPADFDCTHSDLLYIYVDAPGRPLKAVYFDNEGHVIHYDVTLPDAATVVFLSDGSQSGPQFRLTYALKDAVMSGKFQMHMPGQAEWKSYLEWSGKKQ